MELGESKHLSTPRKILGFWDLSLTMTGVILYSALFQSVHRLLSFDFKNILTNCQNFKICMLIECRVYSGFRIAWKYRDMRVFQRF
jgi:hypothetical protein